MLVVGHLDQECLFQPSWHTIVRSAPGVRRVTVGERGPLERMVLTVSSHSTATLVAVALSLFDLMTAIGASIPDDPVRCAPDSARFHRH